MKEGNTSPCHTVLHWRRVRLDQICGATHTKVVGLRRPLVEAPVLLPGRRVTCSLLLGDRLKNKVSLEVRVYMGVDGSGCGSAISVEGIFGRRWSWRRKRARGRVKSK